MMVIVDTTIWSLALRRTRSKLSIQDLQRVRQWSELVHERQVILLGTIRQEILSGIRDVSQFENLRLQLQGWEDEPILAEDHEQAARNFNRCQSKGIASNVVDMLICALSIRLDAPIFTTDQDFNRYATVLPIRLL